MFKESTHTFFSEKLFLNCCLPQMGCGQICYFCSGFSPCWLQAWTGSDLSARLSACTRSITQPRSSLALVAATLHSVEDMRTQVVTSVHTRLSKLKATGRTHQGQRDATHVNVHSHERFPPAVLNCVGDVTLVGGRGPRHQPPLHTDALWRCRRRVAQRCKGTEPLDVTPSEGNI